MTRPDQPDAAPDLSALIAKLEAANEGSRELDVEIMFDLYARPVGKKKDDGPSGYLWPEDNPSWSFGLRFPGKSKEWFKALSTDKEILLIWCDEAFVLMNSLRVPKLTESIDAALTLVPEGWWWHLSHIHAQVCPTHPIEGAGRALNGDHDARNTESFCNS